MTKLINAGEIMHDYDILDQVHAWFAGCPQQD
jgi:hypothetical protein